MHRTAFLALLTAAVTSLSLDAWGGQASPKGPTPLKQCSYMVVVPEVHITRRVPDPAGETEVIRQLVSRGLKVVDQQQTAKIRYNQSVELALTDPQAAQRLGRQYGADVLIVGEAFSELAGANQAGISCRARFEARAIRTADGSIVFADGKRGAGLDIAENVAAKTALQSAASEWAEDFLGVVFGAGGKPIRAPAGGGRRTLAVLGFERASSYAPNLAQAITDMATSALMATNRWELIERQRITDLVSEQRLSLEGITEGRAAQLGGLAKADFVLIGRVVDFGEKKTGGIIGGLGGGLGMSKAKVVLSGRLVDVRRGTIISSIEGKGEATQGQIAGTGLAGVILAAQFDGTALGKATQKAVAELVGKLGFPCPRPSCAHVNSAASKFCAACGNSLAQTAICPGCSKSIPAGAQFCPECGRKL